MGLATITKRFQFHAAHRLPHHDGGCRRLHGHTYLVDVAVSGWIKLPSGQPDEGMVLDFGRIKDIYKSKVDPLVEHQFLNETLQPHLPNVEDVDGKQVGLTTAENLAAWLQGLFSHELRLGDGPKAHVCVTVWETPTSCASYGGSR